MKLSIIIPYYNGEKYIAKCLDSLLQQGFGDDEYEILVVDDGLTNSIDILLGYVNKFDNIKYIHQNNSRQSAARNNGLYNHAKGEYVFFCDCDDHVTPYVLSRLCDIAIDNKLDILLHNVKRIGINMTFPSPTLDFESLETYETGIKYMESSCKIGAGPYEFLARKDFLISNTLKFDQSLIMREDMKFFMDLILVARKIGKINVDAYYYIQNPTSLVHLLGKKELNEVFCKNIISYISYLNKKKNYFETKNVLHQKLKDVFDYRLSEDVFIVLINRFRYSSIKQNKETISEFRNQGLYPSTFKKRKYRNLVWVMNKYSLWIFLCYIFNIIPKSLRKKIF